MKILLAIGEALVVCVFACIVYQVLLLVLNVALDAYKKKQDAKFKQKIDEKCATILEKTANTEAIIAEERSKFCNLPEEYRAEFLAKYDEIEKKVENVKADVARIQASFDNTNTLKG